MKHPIDTKYKSIFSTYFLRYITDYNFRLLIGCDCEAFEKLLLKLSIAHSH